MGESGNEFRFAGDPCQGGLVADGSFFPEIEMIRVGVAVAAESGRLDTMRVAGFELGIDEVVVSGPIGIGFRFAERAEEDGCSLLLREGAEER